MSPLLIPVITALAALPLLCAAELPPSPDPLDSYGCAAGSHTLFIPVVAGTSTLKKTVRSEASCPSNFSPIDPFGNALVEGKRVLQACGATESWFNVIDQDGRGYVFAPFSGQPGSQYLAESAAVELPMMCQYHPPQDCKISHYHLQEPCNAYCDPLGQEGTTWTGDARFIAEYANFASNGGKECDPNLHVVTVPCVKTVIHQDFKEAKEGDYHMSKNLLCEKRQSRGRFGTGNLRDMAILVKDDGVTFSHYSEFPWSVVNITVSFSRSRNCDTVQFTRHEQVTGAFYTETHTVAHRGDLLVLTPSNYKDMDTFSVDADCTVYVESMSFCPSWAEWPQPPSSTPQPTPS
ncbi:hypothetical protein HK104_008516 [Borealophlyctis nickersoniae]|nr:hypothetical protein HK104_008516 [Borealophlyctis nickersoniae]